MPSHDPASVLDSSSSRADYEPLAALALSNALRSSLLGHFVLAAESWSHLDFSGVARPAANGGGACTLNSLACKSRVQNPNAQEVILRHLVNRYRVATAGTALVDFKLRELESA